MMGAISWITRPGRQGPGGCNFLDTEQVRLQTRAGNYSLVAGAMWRISSACVSGHRSQGTIQPAA